MNLCESHRAAFALDTPLVGKSLLNKSFTGPRQVVFEELVRLLLPRLHILFVLDAVGRA